MCMYGWIPSLFTWNYHNSVNQLYPLQNRTLKKKKKEIPSPNPHGDCPDRAQKEGSGCTRESLVYWDCYSKAPKDEWLKQEEMYFLVVLEGRVWGQGVSRVGFLCGLSLACRWLGSPYVCVWISSSCKNTSHVGLGPTLMTSFQLDYLVKDSYLWIVTLSIMAPNEIVDDFNILSIIIFYRVKNTALMKIQNKHIKNEETNMIKLIARALWGSDCL